MNVSGRGLLLESSEPSILFQVKLFRTILEIGLLKQLDDPVRVMEAEVEPPRGREGGVGGCTGRIKSSTMTALFCY